MARREREVVERPSALALDRVIHEPARLMILSVLKAFEVADFVFLLKQTELSRGNLSSHLGKLEEARYVEITKEFVDRVPRTLVRLTENGRAAVAQYRSEMNDLLTKL